MPQETINAQKVLLAADCEPMIDVAVKKEQDEGENENENENEDEIWFLVAVPSEMVDLHHAIALLTYKYDKIRLQNPSHRKPHTSQLMSRTSWPRNASPLCQTARHHPQSASNPNRILEPLAGGFRPSRQAHIEMNRQLQPRLRLQRRHQFLTSRPSRH